jgi:DNA-binding response OmpR family regulator
MSPRKSIKNQPTIVIVDDDAGVRESLKDLLTVENWKCASAESGELGLALVEALRPQLVVADLQLPDMSGYQLCQTLKRGPGSRHVPVIMITGRFTEPEDRLQGLESGADEFFSKPFDPTLFVSRIKSILRGATSQTA